jgi:hypothetical protein
MYAVSYFLEGYAMQKKATRVLAAGVYVCTRMYAINLLRFTGLVLDGIHHGWTATIEWYICDVVRLD